MYRFLFSFNSLRTLSVLGGSVYLFTVRRTTVLYVCSDSIYIFLFTNEDPQAREHAATLHDVREKPRLSLRNQRVLPAPASRRFKKD
jgi:hypothetical protein